MVNVFVLPILQFPLFVYGLKISIVFFLMLNNIVLLESGGCGRINKKNDKNGKQMRRDVFFGDLILLFHKKTFEFQLDGADQSFSLD